MPNKRRNYTLVWTEEFGESDTLNADIWSFEEGDVRNNEKQYYTKNRRENCRIENGKLILEARKEAFEGYDYTSASITTKNSKSFLYGRIEVKAKLPQGRGIWPAIWKKVHGNIHTQAYNHNLETNKGAYIVCDSLHTDFHVFAIDWTPEKIDFFLDEQIYFSFRNDNELNSDTWPFDQPQYLLINLAVGGFWGGKQGIDSTIFPQKFEIDYVRYYKIDS